MERNVLFDMKKLRVKCMKCGIEWEKETSISWGPEDITSSLCDDCFMEVISPVIHKKQLKEGNFDCFGKSGNYCDQLQCKYRQWCIRWEEAGQEVKKVAGAA
ncbi:MAG: hypothetical protein BA872_02415 [Desulfobacterales bacterium C00003060]|nr:MAG: hypothetical protein BA861_01465 [Desulfobacterales bacterium S3730MH5]OEU78271.1 MAG: hypothetical protein BA865_10595 [Desulfobacterales bacterium S5133MH4]OEU80044.1 MAG: hypothetical protein BA872_02415 [Desulfobacterales bacterium C00003060]